ncbi:NRAMP family divalent metal transporter [Acidocella sp.]|uniref:NRAMP family divalent metal transporter n=1 Tax=Acidocella sp. TaxID=50710 RepID=UPI00261BAD50|nr:divalent metal cation transporter [Acidocella sp.]MDD2795245.1 divalent metal cation transporter [Acidocella sp.]
MHQFTKTPNTPPEAPRPAGALRRFIKLLGPGVITGAADDDPSGIATYSQTGAQFGFGQLWTALYQIPLMVAVQECCARIGSVTGQGLAGVIRQHYSRPILVVMVLLVVVANTINIGADIGAVAAASQLVVPAPLWVFTVLTTVIVVTLEVQISYKTYAKALKWLALALLAYPATAFMIREPWAEILRATVIAHVEFTFQFLFIVTGVFGTSISPYMFFWQASEEVEEEIAQGVPSGDDGQPRLPWDFLSNMRIDTAVGMVFAELAQWFIIITTGSVLFRHGITNIATAADAAAALEPLVRSFPNSGQVARDLFAVGVVGLGLLAIPVLAGSAAYAMAEAFQWREGLSRKFGEARGFYGVIIVSTGVGLLLNFTRINPMKALVFTAVFNGIAAVPLLFMIARINASREILGANRGGPVSRTLVWLTFAIMGLCALGMFATLLP